MPVNVPRLTGGSQGRHLASGVELCWLALFEYQISSISESLASSKASSVKIRMT